MSISRDGRPLLPDMELGGPVTGPVTWAEPAQLDPLRPGTALPPGPALRAMGAVLARLHATTPLGVRPAPRPWVLDLPARRVFPGSDRAALDVLDGLLALPAVAAALGRAASAWAPTAVVHGEPTVDNAVGQAHSDAPGASWTVRLVGFDHAGTGAPVWDVVTAVDSLEVSGVLAGVDTSLAVADLLAGYQPDRRIWASWQPFRVARAVHTAATCAAHGTGVAGATGVTAAAAAASLDALVARAAGLAQPETTSAR